MSRLDPKPGRWILPLVVVGIVGFTWVFVNALPPAEEVAAGQTTTSTTEAPDSETTTTAPAVPSDGTTTTTIPPDVAAFLNSADTVATAANDLLTEAREINTTWEEGRNFTLALNSLRDFATRTGGFADSVSATSVPAGLEDLWQPVSDAAADMVTSADDMVSGLQAPDTGQIRRAALADFETAATDLLSALATAVAAAS